MKRPTASKNALASDCLICTVYIFSVGSAEKVGLYQELQLKCRLLSNEASDSEIFHGCIDQANMTLVSRMYVQQDPFGKPLRFPRRWSLLVSREVKLPVDSNLDD